MKNSKDYSKKIQNLYKSLKQKYPKVQKVTHPEIVDALIFGIICEKISENNTESIMKKFSDYFVDLNDMRVSRVEEIAELLGEDNPDNRQIALTLTKVLQQIFNENHKIGLEIMHKIGKRPARLKLEKMDGLSQFVIDYCMLTSLAGHAIPLTEKMIEYLKDNELVDKQADHPTIEGFLAKQIPAVNGYEFYSLLRRESETQKSKKKAARTKTANEEKTKTTKKKTKVVKKTKKTTSESKAAKEEKTTQKKTKKKTKKSVRKK